MPELVTQKNFRLPWELAQRLEEVSRKSEIPQQEIVIRALEQWLREREAEAHSE